MHYVAFLFFNLFVYLHLKWNYAGSVDGMLNKSRFLQLLNLCISCMGMLVGLVTLRWVFQMEYCSWLYVDNLITVDSFILMWSKWMNFFFLTMLLVRNIHLLYRWLISKWMNLTVKYTWTWKIKTDWLLYQLINFSGVSSNMFAFFSMSP